MGSVLLNHWLCLIIDTSVLVTVHSWGTWALRLEPTGSLAKSNPHTLAGYEVHNMLSNEVVGSWPFVHFNQQTNALGITTKEVCGTWWAPDVHFSRKQQLSDILLSEPPTK
jgi:hypothetical protein